MRILKLNLLAVALLLFGATNASAFAINMTARNATTSLDVSDTVTVDIFFDATQVGIRFFGFNVLVSNASTVSYDALASNALPVIYPAPPPATYPGTTGSRPSYILYDPLIAGMAGAPAVFLLPQQTPSWLTFPVPPVGQQQVAINYAELNITDTFDTRTTGSNIWVASLVFHIDAPLVGGENLALSMFAAGSILQLGDTLVCQAGVACGAVTLSAPIQLTGVVPEPTTAMLIGLGLLGLAVSGRRR